MPPAPLVKKDAAQSAEAAQQVRAYFAAQPEPARRALGQIRDAIRSAAPTAVEGFSYRIPSFRLEGRPLVWYAGFRSHSSLFPIGAAILASVGAAAKGYETSTGTIRFPLSEPPPVALIKRLVKARIAAVRDEIARKAARKTVAKTKVAAAKTRAKRKTAAR